MSLALGAVQSSNVTQLVETEKSCCRTLLDWVCQKINSLIKAIFCCFIRHPSALVILPTETVVSSENVVVPTDALPRELERYRDEIIRQKGVLLNLPMRKYIGLDADNQEEFEGMTDSMLRRLSPDHYGRAAEGKRRLTAEEALAFVNTPLKEETINALARWVVDLKASFRGVESTETGLQSIVFGDFVRYLRDLEARDPVEARKILSISPRQLTNQMVANNFSFPADRHQRDANRTIETYLVRDREGNLTEHRQEDRSFGKILDSTIDGADCLNHTFIQFLDDFFGAMHYVQA